MLTRSLISINHWWKVKLPRLSNWRKKLKDNKRITKKSSFRLHKMLKMNKKILRARTNKTRNRLTKCLLNPKQSYSWLRISSKILALTLISFRDRSRTRTLKSNLHWKKRRLCRLKLTKKRLILKKEISWLVTKRKIFTNSRKRPRS